MGSIELTSASLPHVEIVRDGRVVFSTYSQNVDRTEAAIQRAQEVAETIQKLLDKGRANLTTPETEQLTQLQTQAAHLPDPNLSTSSTAGMFLEDLNYDESNSRRQCSFTLRNAKSIVNLGLGDTSTPLTNTDVVVFWDVETVSTIFDAARLPSDVIAEGRLDVGTYRIDQTSMSVEPDGSLTLAVIARDAMQIYVDVALAANYSIPAGSNPVTEIIKIINLFDAGAKIYSTSTAVTVGPMSWEQGTSYMSIIRDIAQPAGLVVYVDRDGAYHIEIGSERPDDILDDDGFRGFSTSSVVAATRDVRRNGVINGVIVRGENITAGGSPVEAAAWIETGPYAFSASGDGGIGPMPLVIVDRAITSETEAAELARSQLAEKGGVPETVTVQILVDPQVSAGDVIRLNIPEIGATGNYTVDSVRTSSSQGQQTTVLTMKERSGR